MSTTYYTSDLHIGHSMVANLRGFAITDEHDDWIASFWDYVKPDDTVWVLGDLAATDKGAQRAVDVLKALPGHKHLIAGNHDRVWPARSQAHKFYGLYFEAFESVQFVATKKIDGRRVTLSHMPIIGDHTSPDRYPNLRLPDRDSGVILHGHTHSTHRISYTPMGTQQIHVGVDAWDGLVPEHKISAVFLTPIGATT